MRLILWKCQAGERCHVQAVCRRRLRLEVNEMLIKTSRMNDTMKRLQKLSESEQSDFVRTLFGQTSPTPVPANLDEAVAKLEWITGDLNDSQQGMKNHEKTEDSY